MRKTEKEKHGPARWSVEAHDRTKRNGRGARADRERRVNWGRGKVIEPGPWIGKTLCVGNTSLLC